MAENRVQRDFGPGDPEPGAETFLRRLELAGGVLLDPDEDGRRVDSTELFEAAQYRVVASRLFARERRDTDAENNLGCARAWLREYDEADAALTASAEKGDGAARARAERNLELVARARDAGG